MVNKSLPQRHSRVGIPLRFGRCSNFVSISEYKHTATKEISSGVIIMLQTVVIPRHSPSIPENAGDYKPCVRRFD